MSSSGLAYTLFSRVQPRGAQPGEAHRERIYDEQLTLDRSPEEFVDALEGWLSNEMGGDRPDLRLTVNVTMPHVHRALHLAFREHHTEALSNATRLKRLTEHSAPIPAMGVVFLLLVGVDPAGLPPSDSPTFRANYIKRCLNAVGLELADSQYDERSRASSCVRFLGNPSGNNFFNIEVMLNVNTARQQAAFYALVNGRTKLLMEADVVPIDVTWLYHGQSCTPKVKL